jgi:hypothetical protein
VDELGVGSHGSLGSIVIATSQVGYLGDAAKG